MPGVEIIVTGNEVLNGDVLDSNSNWICKRITGIGATVDQITAVRDNVDKIAFVLKEAIQRNPAVIFTIGGLGPTADDMTLQGVAFATDHRIELNPEALELVKQRYRELALEGRVDNDSMNSPREKMAMLPSNAEPLANTVGAAPGVLLKLQRTTIISLPGVPDELKSIFENSLQPFLREKFGAGLFVEKVVIVNSKDESQLAPILREVSERNAGVYIKSRPKRFGPHVKFKVTISLAGASKSEVDATIDRALADLESALRQSNISIDSVEG